jgi:hypothetical protein
METLSNLVNRLVCQSTTGESEVDWRSERGMSLIGISERSPLGLWRGRASGVGRPRQISPNGGSGRLAGPDACKLARGLPARARGADEQSA